MTPDGCDVVQRRTITHDSPTLPYSVQVQGRGGGGSDMNMESGCFLSIGLIKYCEALCSIVRFDTSTYSVDLIFLFFS